MTFSCRISSGIGYEKILLLTSLIFWGDYRLILKYASDELKDELKPNRAFILAAVRQAGLPALQYASEALQNDKYLQYAATIPLVGLAMQYPNAASSMFALATAFTIQGLVMLDTHLVPKRPLGITFFDVISDELCQVEQGAQYPKSASN